MMFETELKIFGVVNGDKTSRADGMLLLQPSFYHLAEYFIHNKSQNISIYFSLCNVAVYFDGKIYKPVI